MTQVVLALRRTVASRRFWRFATVGGSGVVVNLGMLAFFVEVAGVGDEISSALAIEVSILTNFLLNNAWTFRDRNSTARAGFVRRLGYYNMISLVGMGIQLLTFVGMNMVFVATLELREPGSWRYLSQLTGIGIATGFNFLFNFHLTWAQAASAQTGGADGGVTNGSDPGRA